MMPNKEIEYFHTAEKRDVMFCSKREATKRSRENTSKDFKLSGCCTQFFLSLPFIIQLSVKKSLKGSERSAQKTLHRDGKHSNTPLTNLLHITTFIKYNQAASNDISAVMWGGSQDRPAKSDLKYASLCIRFKHA